MTFWRRALAAASSFFETASARLFEIVLISERKLFARRRRFSDWRTRLRACFEWAMELLGVFLESGITGKGRDHIPRPGERQALSTPPRRGIRRSRRRPPSSPAAGPPAPRRPGN